MNPRVSRSSALASKATGYPIAKVAAKLAVGYTLDEIPNDLTGTTPASFEPTLDYVVVKFPRFAFEKFPGADTTLGTQMKSVGEAMGIGRTFGEAFLKARRSRELDGVDAWELPEGAHPWFRAELERLESSAVDASRRPRRRRLAPPQAARASRTRRSPRAAGRPRRSCGRSGGAGGSGRRTGGSTPAPPRSRRRSNYFYSTWGEADEAAPDGDKPRVVILGSGPNRIGQGIEFDYCCVHAAQAFRALGYEAVMVNCNPETVSTDYDTSDRLYFEPLGAEEVLEICARELPDGVVIQFGGQTPLKLAREIEAEGWRILGTPFDAVDLAEDRERFAALCDELDVAVPSWAVADGRRAGGRTSPRRSATRCSCARRTCSAAATCRSATTRTRSRGGPGRRADPRRPLPRGRDRDRRRRALRRAGHVCRGRHGARRGGRRPLGRLVLRPAGAVARRGDAARDRGDRSHGSRRRSESSASSTSSSRSLEGEVFVLEANPRASRTVPFASKAIGVNLVEAACRLAAGARLSDLDLSRGQTPQQVSVKAAVLPFARFPGADPVLGPGDALDRRGDGERGRPPDRVREGRASRRAAAADGGHRVPLRARRRQAGGRRGRASRSPKLGFRLVATAGTAQALAAAGHRRRPRAQGDRGGRGADRRRPRSAAGAATSSSTRRSAARARAPTAT